MNMQKRKSNWLTKLALLGGLVFFMAGCHHIPGLEEALDDLAKPGKVKTYYGQAISVGEGVGKAWVSVDEKGNPTAIGVDVSEEAILSMGDEFEDFLFPLPKQASRTPIDHLTLEWNPHGHDPTGVYDKSHFDLHFYLMPEQDRLAIPGKMPPYMDPAPAAKYMPDNYLQGPGVVPAMGVHWVDLLSDEFKPDGAFTKTFIYGTYGGKFTFYEPMFTRNYLNTKPHDVVNIRQPQAFARSGYYPTSYSVIYKSEPKEYTFSLNNLTYRQGE